jgi:hypothetical protein
MRVVAGAGCVLNRASVPSQFLRGVCGVLNRTGNRTGECTPSVPHGELMGCLGAGSARRGRRSAETQQDTGRGGNTTEEPYRKRTKACRGVPGSGQIPFALTLTLSPKGRESRSRRSSGVVYPGTPPPGPLKPLRRYKPYKHWGLLRFKS